MADFDPFEGDFDEAENRYDEADRNYVEQQTDLSMCEPNCTQQQIDAMNKASEAKTTAWVEMTDTMAKNVEVEDTSFLQDIVDDPEVLSKDWTDPETWGGDEAKTKNATDFAQKMTNVFFDALGDTINESSPLEQYQSEFEIKVDEDGKLEGKDADSVDKLKEKLSEDYDNSEEAKKKTSKSKYIKWAIIMILALGIGEFIYGGVACQAAQSESGCAYRDKDGNVTLIQLEQVPDKSFCGSYKTCCGDCRTPFSSVYPRDKCIGGNCCNCDMDMDRDKHCVSGDNGLEPDGGEYLYYCKTPMDVMSDLAKDAANALNPSNILDWVKQMLLVVVYIIAGILGVYILFKIAMWIMSGKKKKDGKK